MDRHNRIEALRQRFEDTLQNALRRKCEWAVLQQVRCELTDNPDDGMRHEAVGLALAAVGLSEQAVPVLETAQVLLPLVPAAELALAECYLEAGKPGHAAPLLSNVGTRSDAECSQRLRAARLLEEIGARRAAWTICRRTVQDFPDEAQAWFDLSYIMGRLGCPFPQIESAALRAINLAPQVVKYRMSLASALHQRDRVDDALLLVQRFGAEQIEGVECECCVERLQLMFESSGDWQRAMLCRDRLTVLKRSSVPPDSDESEFTSGDAV